MRVYKFLAFLLGLAWFGPLFALLFWPILLFDNASETEAEKAASAAACEARRKAMAEFKDRMRTGLSAWKLQPAACAVLTVVRVVFMVGFFVRFSHLLSAMFKPFAPLLESPFHGITHSLSMADLRPPLEGLVLWGFLGAAILWALEWSLFDRRTRKTEV